MMIERKGARMPGFERVETTRMVCHAANCGATHYVPDGKTPPGYVGTTTRTETDGTTVGPVEFYACRATHIRPAIVAVTTPDTEGEPEPTTPEESADDDDDDDEDAEQDADTSADALLR